MNIKSSVGSNSNIIDEFKVTGASPILLLILLETQNCICTFLSSTLKSCFSVVVESKSFVVKENTPF